MLNIKCPDCGSSDFFINKHKGEVICKKCAMVVDDALCDLGRERAMDQETLETHSRSGAPFDPRVANNLATTIGNTHDLSGLSKNTQQLIKRIKKKNNWTSSGIEQNLRNALTHLKLISDYLSLPDNVEKEVARIYRRSVEQGLTKARSCEMVLIGCVYISCRIHGIPKKMEEVAEAQGITKKSLGKIYKMLLRELKINIIPSNPIDYLGRFTSELKLSPKVQSKAIELIDCARKKKLTSGISPLSLAAASLYISALMNKEKKGQKKVSDVCGITETTLRQRVRDLVQGLKLRNKAVEQYT